MILTPGIYYDMDNETYHNHKESLSRSSIRDFADCPYKYWALHLNPLRPPKVKTDEMVFGSAFHTFVLEPDKFMEEYAIEPKKVLLKDVGRTDYDAYKEMCANLALSNKIILTSEDLDVLMEMQRALHRDNRVMDLINGAEIEKSFFWNDPMSGLLVKARPDILHRNMIVDLKTIADASPESFRRSMVSGGYHWQAAMIRDAVRTHEERDITNVINICVEKKYPYSVGIYLIDEAAIEVGQSEYKHQLLGIKQCKETDEWPDYAIETVGLPKWYS